MAILSTINGKQYELPRRDSQQRKVYEAEHDCFAAFQSYQQLQNPTQEQVQLLVDGMFYSHFGRGLLIHNGIDPKNQRSPRVVFMSRGSWATGSAARITLPPWALNLTTVIHELAHAMTPSVAGHSWVYCMTMLSLVGEFMGPEWQEQLETYYTRYKVKFTPQKDHEADAERLFKMGRLAVAKKRS